MSRSPRESAGVAMVCNQTRETLLDPGSGEAARRQIADALEHLHGCADCQRAMHDFDRLQSMLAGDPQEEPVPVGGWQQFEQRLAGKPRLAIHWQPWALTGIAAALFIALLARDFLMTEKPRPSANDAPLAIAATANKPAGKTTDQADTIDFTPREVARQVSAFNAVSDVFDHKASWLLVADNASDMGVSNTPIKTDHHLLLLRLTMLHDKQIVSAADLAIVAGQKAKLSVPLAQGISGDYEIGTTGQQPTRLSIWAQLKTPQGSEPLAALSTTLEMQTGDNRSAGTMVTSAGGYELNVAFSRAELQ